MGFTEILTVVFIVLKLLGVISWSWWIVLLPEIIASVLYLIVFFMGIFGGHRTYKRVKRHFDDF